MLSSLTYPKGSKKSKKRIGRGLGSQGKQSGRGHKGQLSRSGGKVSAWFEGGQTPLKLRSPKRGFTNRNKIKYDLVNLKDFVKFGNKEKLSIDDFKSEGLVSGKRPVKVLGDGEIKRKIHVIANAFTKGAGQKIKDAGGQIEII